MNFVDEEDAGAPLAPAAKSLKKLVPSMSISGLSAEVFSVKFSPDGKYIAAGCGDGTFSIR